MRDPAKQASNRQHHRDQHQTARERKNGQWRQERVDPHGSANGIEDAKSMECGKNPDESGGEDHDRDRRGENIE